MPPKDKVRVRIAPSPTGYLHIGTARTALFNWIFAKKHGGVFIVRIEDTDEERSEPKYEQDILEELAWLGLEWEEGPITQSQISNLKSQKYLGSYGPYRQSERGEIYEKYVKKLLDENHAYYCFCTKDELDAMRNGMLSEGFAPKYSGRCRDLSQSEVQKNIVSGKESVIRLKIPETKISFTDIVRDKVEFDMSLIGDIVIAKSPRQPLYNLAAIIDDYEMKISHVIRAEDHLANTPKQILMQRLLNLPQPHYAHLPLILNPDRSKMSKRFAATAVAEYRAAGYLPDALFNFLALLGWHPQPEILKGDRIKEKEIFSRAELIDLFDLERVQRGGAVFNQEKLDWLNAQYIKKMSDDELGEKIKRAVEIAPIPQEQFLKAVKIARGRMAKLGDFLKLSGFIFNLPDYPPELLIWRETPKNKILENLQSALEVLESLKNQEFIQEKLTAVLTPLANSRGRGEVLWPLRAALSGAEASPGPFEIMEVLGKDETINRIKNAIKKISL